MVRCPFCLNKIELGSRSNPQNDLYWGYCVEPFAKFKEKDGYTKDDVHELFKMDCNYKVKTIERNGHVFQVKVPQSTSGLTKSEFSEYINRVIKYAAEQGCYLSIPGDM